MAPMDYPARVNHKERPLGHTTALIVGAVQAGHMSFRLEVCQEWIAQAQATSERRVTPDTVDGDAYQLCLMPVEQFACVVVQGSLIATDRAPVSRVEEQDHRTAAQVAQAQRITGSAWQLEIWRRGSWCENCSRGLKMVFLGGPGPKQLHHRVVLSLVGDNKMARNKGQQECSKFA